MTTALVEPAADRPVKDTVGMTGEITLQGAVLPIGGVKQKVLAAHRAGLTEVVLPKRNGADLEDVPEAVREEMTFHLANTDTTSSPPPSPDRIQLVGDGRDDCRPRDTPGRPSAQPGRMRRRATFRRLAVAAELALTGVVGADRRPHRRRRLTPTPATRGAARCAGA